MKLIITLLIATTIILSICTYEVVNELRDTNRRLIAVARKADQLHAQDRDFLAECEKELETMRLLQNHVEQDKYKSIQVVNRIERNLSLMKEQYTAYATIQKRLDELEKS